MNNKKFHQKKNKNYEGMADEGSSSLVATNRLQCHLIFKDVRSVDILRNTPKRFKKL